MDRIRQMEFTMAANPVYCGLETERAYWQTRLANLEMLLCELLIKNERLREERLMFTPAQPDQGNSSNGFLKGLLETGSKSRNYLPGRSVASALGKAASI